MKKIILLMLLCAVGLVGCGADKQEDSENKDISIESTFIVLEASENYLLVAEIGDDGKVIEVNQYSAPNPFHPDYEIVVGEKVVICHNGVALESYPMQFAHIYSMSCFDNSTTRKITVNVD